MRTNQTFSDSGLELQYPLPLGVYDQYAEAQYCVDHLADHAFPVENLMIVGTELRSIERVTGRLTRGRMAVAGALSGFWMGLFVGIAFTLFSSGNEPGFLFTTPPLGAVFGLVWSQLGYSALTRHGNRDFSSVDRVVATKYEVLVEHKHAARARELLAAMPPMKTAGPTQ